MNLSLIEFFHKLINFLFLNFFIFSVILAVCELAMPGFVIYYFNLNWILLITFGLFLAKTGNYIDKM
jgi:hypothetical protein